MRNWKQPGDKLTILAPSGGVVSSQGYLLGQLFGVATDTAAETVPVAFQMSGVIRLTKTAPQTWAVGDHIFWDDGAKSATTSGPADAFIGGAAQVAASAAIVGEVNLNDIAQAPELGTAGLADGSVTLAKTAQFISIEQTGTGAPQNIAHGLGAVPAGIFVAPTDLAPATVGDYTVGEGAHDATNVVLTVTTSKKFKVLAWA